MHRAFAQDPRLGTRLIFPHRKGDLPLLILQRIQQQFDKDIKPTGKSLQEWLPAMKTKMKEWYPRYSKNMDD